MGHLITVATCSLNQWALDWEGNAARIVESIQKAKAAGARLRVGPELEICGYGCLDHLLEQDLYLHCFEMLRRILLDETCHGILLDIGMPVQHRNQRFNCRVLCLDGKILMIRPKMWLANDGNYREMRHFTPWMHPRQTEQYHLPRILQDIQGSTHVIFGDAVVSTPDTCFGAETCEELFTPNAPHIAMSLDGVEIITNSSGSHFTLQKLDTRLQLIMEATRKCGGVYLYANQQGCDGDRLYYDGSAMILVNGDVVAQGSQFSLNDVEVVTATVDLEEVRAYRSAISRGLQAARSDAKYQRIQTAFELSSEDEDADIMITPSPPIKPKYYSVEEEIALCAGCYLWDIRNCRLLGTPEWRNRLLRHSEYAFLSLRQSPLKSVATDTPFTAIVFSMCRIVMKAVEEGNAQVIEDVKRLAKYDGEDVLPKTPQALCNQIFSTIYMGMKTQSSVETRQRARDLAEAIGSYHINLDIDDVYNAQKSLAVTALNFEPRFKVEGGTNQENLTLQCIQARIRMVTAYEFGQLLPTARGRPGGGGLLVLGSANVGEYRYPTPCLHPDIIASADINPIGSIDKADLKRFIAWAEKDFNIPCLHDFLTAVPTAELEPISETYVQSDEVDMGMTYQELTIMGRLRKVNKLGPYGMFQRLVHDWSVDRKRGPDDDAPAYEPSQTADKVKKFFHFYAINRHKMTTLTPALHCNDYSPDDNRFDLRPFLYPPFWKSWSFKKIDAELAKIEKRRAKTKA
ncbi:carbon-nitrogen hydrolase [Colletotrichum cuscutae]|uniref:Glutamine-dependent NAD(+) synthetase n=1 Tax=Colletotrichum cuscutae TaxID=1209917 RepID=A0AAJ0DMS6_9PEZI|nr:carbon-nitrogen hydrolase [Colletotrichum cuscutae]